MMILIPVVMMAAAISAHLSCCQTAHKQSELTNAFLPFGKASLQFSRETSDGFLPDHTGLCRALACQVKPLLSGW
jgi:hypothetical protein